jgi:hypothetical protein
LPSVNHFPGIPVTNTSVNPARSTGVALFVGDWAIAQLWLFWVAPMVGALLGAAAYRLIGGAVEMQIAVEDAVDSTSTYVEINR